jgi:long-chain fatty acid transport protein
MIKVRSFLFAPLLLCLLPYSVHAAGLWLYEQAAPDMGLATAGRAALATDASTAAGNPAGMTRLERNQLEGGFLGILVKTEFDTDSSTFGGGDGGDAGGFVPAGSFSYVHSLTPDLKIGISAGSNFGLGLDYDKTWAGRYYVQEGELVVMGVNPGVGYRVSDWFSVGAGFSILYGSLDQKAAVNNNPLGIGNDPDGRIKLDEDDVGYGYNLGILLEPVSGTRFGLTYRSKIDIDFDDAVSSKDLSPGLAAIVGGVLGPNPKVDMGITIPQAVMFSAYHQLSKQWAVLGNIGWQDQSDFGKTSISLKSTTSTSFTADRNFHDTYHFAVGTQYRFAPSWLLSVGVAYDESPVDSADRTPDMPLDRQWRYATGLQYDVNEDLTIGAAYTFLDAGKAKINQSEADNPLRGELSGDYSSNYIQFFNVNVVYRF